MPPAACRRHTLWTICLCGLMEHLADGERDIRELPLKFLLQNRDDHIFRAEVIGVDQVDAKLLCREEAVVLHVCRHEGVAALRSRQLQHISAGAAANCDSFHRQATVYIPQPVGVQTSGNIGQKFRHGHGVRKLPYTSAGKRAPVGRRTGRLQAACDLRAQRRHERIIDAAVGNVQIRVHTDGGNAVPRHGQHLASGEIIRRRVPQRRKDEWVVRNNELRAQLIVSHHPLIFTPLRHATADDLAGRKVLTMARHGISAICMHTNLDIADGGVNDALMAALGAEVTGGLEPAGTAADGRTLTCGRVGKLPNPMTMAEFLPYVAGRLHANGLRYVDGSLPVERIAVCGGPGGNMLELAAAKGCDTFVTADVKYNRFLAAKELGINLIDADHFCTENVVIPVLQEKLQRQFPDVTFTVSQVLHQTAQTYCP